MNRTQFIRLVAAGAALTLVGAVAHAEESSSNIKFSDPSKPGTLRLAVSHGDIDIHGIDGAEVVVKSEAQPKHHVRKDGLRVLTEAASFALSEKDNVVTLETGPEGWSVPSNFRISVPRNTNIVIANAFGGDIRCGGITGDIDVKSMNGEVKLDDVTGGALVETMNGEITANIRDLKSGKPISFTSTNGQVLLRVPGDTKANVRLRTQNGTILTDFDESALVTKVEAAPRMTARGKGRMALTEDTHRAMQEAGRAIAIAGEQTAQALREAAEAARKGLEGTDDDDDRTTPRTPKSPKPPVPPKPPMPPAIPTVTGGKLVTGTLNGGGPEITVATMNGDVTLRKLDSK